MNAPSIASLISPLIPTLILALGLTQLSLPAESASASAPTVLTAAPRAHAQTLRILTFNVEHHQSAERFTQWQTFCEAQHWQESSTTVRPDRLTYCNALDGTDGRGRRLFAPVHDASAWREKVALLRALIRAADADIVLLQEVSDAAAAQLILGADYHVASSAELWHRHAIAQNLAFGWRTTLPGPLPQIALIESISQAGADGRRTRSGLAMTLEPLPGRPLAILNLHLKAGCRHGRLDQATSRKPDRAFRREADCAVFQRQVPAIEAWADTALSNGFGVIIAGDFNRHLLREVRDRMPARSDAGDPAAPADPRRIASLVAELSDRSPPDAWFSLVRNGPYRKLADCHRNIDNFLVSRNLEIWLARPARMLKVDVIAFADPISLDRVRPSDHCPHRLDLPLGGPR